ncbi:MAG TPA: HEAT repeat domain-containing protein [Candidatus Eisenbacteria bacterium]|nr:HEAT repeat domain-containing protein [Candidatus Eisenbacteria bacterium]
MRHDVTIRGVKRSGGLAAMGLAAGVALAALAAPRAAAAATAIALPAASEVTFLRAEGTRDTTGLAALVRADARPAVRARAARALGHIGRRGSRPLLEAALRDAAPAVRREAAFALGLVADSLAAPAVLERLGRETDAPTRVALVTTLGNLGARSGGAVGRALAASLRSPRAPERWAAAFAAARLRDSTLVEPLDRASRDPRPDIRWRAAYALGRIGDRRAAPALRKLSFDRDPMVRAVAARAIGEVGDSTATARLGALLHDESWRVRVNAAASLGALKIMRESRTLLPHLADAHPHVRWQVAISLGAVRDSLAVPALLKALGDSSTGVVQAAAASLLKIQGDRAVPAVAPALDLLPAFLRGGLAEALGDVDGPAARELMLARAAQTTDPAQAAGAASALAKRPEARDASIPVLRPRLQDRDFSVVCSAAEALGALRDSASVPALAALFQRRATTQDDDVRTSAATALAALETAAARAALRPALLDSDARVREIAARALALPADSVPVVPGAPLKARATPATERQRLTAVVTTERGVITIALDASAAPENVENFASLARAGYFDGIQFHRVVPNFVIQSGCPRGDGWGGPGYAIPCEYDERPYEIGTVGMALSGKDTGGSQWFVTLSPQPRLEGRYSILGKVTQGLDVAERIMPGDRIVRIAIR